MQNTRLNRLVDDLAGQFARWLQNPWRRVSLIVLSLLLGNFLATALATIAGQTAQLDILAGAILVAITESISWLFYRGSGGGRSPSDPPTPSFAVARPYAARSLIAEILNALKIGLIYGLAIEAFKLGS